MTVPIPMFQDESPQQESGATQESGAGQGAQLAQSKAKERSPNYPAVSLTDSIKFVGQLYEKERRTAVAPEQAARAFGFSGLSGPARSTLAALRQFGLVENVSGGAVRISDLGMTIIQYPVGSPERNAAIRSAAMKPPLIVELAGTHSGASDGTIKAHLVTQKKFSQDGAGRFVGVFRDALKLAKLGDEGYNADMATATEIEPAPGAVSAAATAYGGGTMPPQLGNRLSVKPSSVVFSGLLGKGIFAEVRVTGDDVRPDHIERLRKYLELAKDALADVGDGET